MEECRKTGCGWGNRKQQERARNTWREPHTWVCPPLTPVFGGIGSVDAPKLQPYADVIGTWTNLSTLILKAEYIWASMFVRVFCAVSHTSKLMLLRRQNQVDDVLYGKND